MTDVVLLDAEGVERTYEGVETLSVSNPDGGTETFVSERLIQTQAQSDWSQTDETAVDYIKNKPTIPSTDGLASEQFVKDEIAKIDIPSVSTEGLASEEYVQEKISEINIPSIEGLASEKYVDDKTAEVAKNQAQADFAEIDPSKSAFIKNKIVGYKADHTPLTTLTYEIDMTKYPAASKVGTIVEGENYIVTWDGVDYPCVGKECIWSFTIGGIFTTVALGNAGLYAHNNIALESPTATDEPFLFINDFESYAKTAGEHTVRISLADNIIKLDEKYLPDDIKLQPDWAQMDSTQKDFIKNKPTLSDVATSGSYNDLRNRPTLAPVATEGTYASLKEKPFGDTPVPLAEITMYFSPMEDFPDTYVTTHIGKELLLGESYIVKWDGTEYTCICRKEPGANTPVLGNTTKIFWPTGEDTGEPFCVAWDSEKNLVGIPTDETDATHTISITPVDAVQKLDSKYLPDLALVATKGTYASLTGKPCGDIPTILEESSISFYEIENMGVYQGRLYDSPEMIIGAQYVVKWGDKEWICTAKSGEWDGVGLDKCLGNTTKVFGLGAGSDTGEPFCIYGKNTSNDLYIHTLESNRNRIITITPVATVQKLDKKYLPDGIATEEFVTRKIAEIEIPEGGSGGSGVSGGITAADVTAMLASAGVIVPVAVEDNLLLTDSNNDIYIL